MPRIELEPPIPVFEGKKTIHVLDRSALWSAQFNNTQEVSDLDLGLQIGYPGSSSQFVIQKSPSRCYVTYADEGSP
jgi:hypothetical protein